MSHIAFLLTLSLRQSLVFAIVGTDASREIWFIMCTLQTGHFGLHFYGNLPTLVSYKHKAEFKLWAKCMPFWGFLTEAT